MDSNEPDLCDPTYDDAYNFMKNPSDLATAKNILKANSGFAHISGEYGDTPLLWACRRKTEGVEEFVKCLLEAGAQVDRTSELGSSTPLIWAAGYSTHGVCKQLLKAKANPNATSNGMTPLMAAATGGNVSIVDALIRAGAHVDAKNGTLSPIIYACVCGNSAAVSRLELAGADLENGGTYTALMAAVEYNQPEIVKALLSYGADPNAIYHRYNRFVKVSGKNHLVYTHTPLLYACRNGLKGIVADLLDAGADPTLAARGFQFEYTPSMCASSFPEIVALLATPVYSNATHSPVL